MSETCLIRLFGGLYDGDTTTVTPDILTAGLRMPVPTPPSIAYAFPISKSPAFMQVEVYRWDGTVNEAGEHRFRWTP